jgi:hypothetical protein
MRLSFLAAAAAAFTATAAGILPTAPAAAYPRCNSFNAGIGECVNSGWNNGSFQSRSRYNGGYQPMLLEQPRFQPTFGQGYYPSSGRSGSYW